MKQKAVAAGALVFLLCSCAGSSEQSQGQIVQILDSIKTHAVAENYFFMNRERASHFRKVLEDPSSDKRFASMRYCEELLYAGETEKAISAIDSLTGILFPAKGVTLNSKPFYDLLAVAYLRKGEQENCIDHHTAESCVIPISPGGVHVRKGGSSKAVELYLKILRAFPDDVQSRWLLNIAYMTLGMYPDGVPSRYLIELPAATSSLGKFKDVASSLGVDVRDQAGGCVMEDFDNDGFLDIMTSSLGLDDPLRVFFNTGRGTFEERTQNAGLSGLTSGLNLVSGDYNNDGNVDVFVTRNGWLGSAGKIPNSLLRNNGNGTFTDVTVESGMLSFYATQTAAFADFNKDGWLDLFVGNEFGPDHRYPCEMFVNNGDGTFSEQARPLGLEVNAFVKGVSWGDIDNDGLPDLYVSILGGRNLLFLNEGKTRTGWGFREIAQSAGVREPFFSFVTWFFDYDNDGWQDLFVGGFNTQRYGNVAQDVAAEYLGRDHSATLPKLYRNLGNNTFQDVTMEMDLDKVIYAMGSNFGDLNNDGFADLYFGTGAPEFGALIPNRVFINASKTFQEVTFAAGFGQIQKGHAVAFGDIDNDGDQDIYTVIGGFYEGDVYPNMLLENPGNANNHAALKFIGTSANRCAVGARFTISGVDSQNEARQIHGTVGSGGSFGASSILQEVGLAGLKGFDLEVIWPDLENTKSRFLNLPANAAIEIVQGRDSVQVSKLKKTEQSAPSRNKHVH